MDSSASDDDYVVLIRLPVGLAQNLTMYLRRHEVSSTYDRGVSAEDSPLAYNISFGGKSAHSPQPTRSVTVPRSQLDRAQLLLDEWHTTVDAQLALHTNAFRKGAAISLLCFSLVVVMFSLISGDWVDGVYRATFCALILLLVAVFLRTTTDDNNRKPRNTKRRKKRR